MNLPFTTEQFLKVFEVYNQAVWPMQIAFVLLALTAIGMAVYKKNYSDILISSILAFYWLWMGIVYHLLFFTSINKAAFIFGTLFIVQGLIFVFFGVVRREVSFLFQKNIYGLIGAALILYALAFYPMLGFELGHRYPQSPTFGLPCPTTIFTFGLLLWTDKRVPVVIMIIPFLWSLIGFTAALKLGIKEDIGLLIAGLSASFIVVLRNFRFGGLMR